MVPQEELDETQILAALLGISEMVGGLTETQEILESIARIAPVLVRVDRCAFFEYDETTREFRPLVVFEPSGLKGRFEGLVLQESDVPRFAQRLVKQRLPILVKDAGKDPNVPPALVQRLGVRSALVAPLVCRGKVLGALWLDSTRGQHYFTSKEINVVQGIASQAAIALDSAKSGDAAAFDRARFEALAASLADGVIATDPERRIHSLDGGAERLLGWSSAEIRGRRMAEVFDLTEGEASLSWTMDAAGPAPVRKDLALRAHDGARVPCEVSGVVVRGPEGAIRQILFVLRRKGDVKDAEERAADALHQLADVAGTPPRPE